MVNKCFICHTNFHVSNHVGICVTATVKIQSGRPVPNISGLEIVLPPLHQVNYFQHSLTEVKGKDGNLDGLLLG